MKIKMNLKTKMLVYILAVSSIIYALALGYVSLKLNSISINNAKELTDTYAREYANHVKADLNVDMNMARALADVSKGYKNIDPQNRKEIHKEMLLHLIQENSNFLSTWYNWELSALWPDWDKPHGRLRLTYYRMGGQILYKEEILDTVPGFTRGAYYDIMDKKIEYVMDPYFFAYQQGEDEILETSVTVPILDDNKAVGMAGFDLPLQRFQDLIVNI
ncbi:MAG TPA: cache domain-containing protein, partial [Bacteroidales bacterium]|nr:cache domain-containing protein [Bacteroidales bacterium]